MEGKNKWVKKNLLFKIKKMGDVFQDIVKNDNESINIYDKTISNWQEDLILLLSIYEDLLSEKNKSYTILSICCFVFTSITSLLSVSQYILDSNTIQILTTAFTLLNSVFITSIRISGLVESIKNIQEYYIIIHILLSKIVSRNSLPETMKTDAKEFIANNIEEYNQIVLKIPMINSKKYNKYKLNYNQTKNTA